MIYTSMTPTFSLLLTLNLYIPTFPSNRVSLQLKKLFPSILLKIDRTTIYLPFLKSLFFAMTFNLTTKLFFKSKALLWAKNTLPLLPTFSCTIGNIMRFQRPTLHPFFGNSTLTTFSAFGNTLKHNYTTSFNTLIPSIHTSKSLSHPVHPVLTFLIAQSSNPTIIWPLKFIPNLLTHTGCFSSTPFTPVTSLKALSKPKSYASSSSPLTPKTFSLLIALSNLLSYTAATLAHLSKTARNGHCLLPTATPALWLQAASPV